MKVRIIKSGRHAGAPLVVGASMEVSDSAGVKLIQYGIAEKDLPKPPSFKPKAEYKPIIGDADVTAND